MIVTKLETTLIDIPFDKPIKTTIHDIRSVGCVLLELQTDEGITGQSLVFTLNGLRLKSLWEMIRGFRHQIEGRDPHYIGAIWEALWNEMNPIGHKGFSVAALSAIDTACWDIIAKASGQPLHWLFGACRDEIRTYASGGLWLSLSIDDCLKQASDFVDQGFRSMKIRVGSTRIEQDVERVKHVRETVGPNIEILADANQGLSVKQAIRLGHALEEFNIGWLEEPVGYQNLKGHAALRIALNTPIATGETEYTRYGMRGIIEADAVDILMPDLQRIGGLSEMRRTAALAATYDIPISTHLFTEYSLCIGGSESHCISVEHMPWFASLFNESLEINNGKILIPQRPGTGFSFNHEAVRRFKID